MKCTICGSDIKNKNNFCPNCGANMNITAEIINSAINKDNNAYTELYRRTYDDVYRVIYVLVKDQYNTEELVSETYIQGFNKLSQLDKPESFLPWIKKIARNKTIDLLRKNKSNMFVESFEGINQDYDEEGLNLESKLADESAVIPIDAVDKMETHRLMEQILNNISEEQRCVVTMFYYDQLSIKEISEILGCSENTVKSRLSYGRKKIQQEVLSLEKKGTKLYGLAPIPFFVFLLKVYNTIPVNPLPATVFTSIESAVVGTTVASTVSSTVASTTASVVTTATKGVALKVTAGIVAGVVAVSGGVIGGKKLYDNYKVNNATKPSTTVAQTMPTTVATTTVPMTTVHMYKELSGSDTDYIKTLLAYTIFFPSNDYSKMSESDMVDLLSMYYMVKENYEEGKDFFPTSEVVEEQGYKVKIAQKDFQNVAKNAFNKTLSNFARSSSVELKNGYYYFGVPASVKHYNINVKDVKYNKDKSKVTVTYTFNGETIGEKTTEHTATFTRNENNKNFPFRINSKKEVREIATNPTTPTEPTKKTETNVTAPKTNFTEYKNLKYDGKVVDFGDYTIKVPNSWKYEIDEDGQPMFYEPKTRKQGGGAHLIDINISDYWDENEPHTGTALLGSKNGKYFIAQGYMSVEAYMEDGQRVSEKWEDIYNSAYNLTDSVLTTFKLK